MPVPQLSAVEEQVVLLVAQGGSIRTVAAELGLSVKTVEWHVARARLKLERAAALGERVEQARLLERKEE